MNSSNKVFRELSDEEESADYFFHYTTEIEHLTSIMNNYFMPFYCMESIEYLDLPELNIKGMAYPVVCFCDLPFKRQKEHKNKFGEYGIGMKKEWGIKNLLSPVVYTHSRSMTAVSLKILINMSASVEKNCPVDFNKYNKSASILMMHYKAYEGHQYIKKDKLFSEISTRFYDEREWRYIPLNTDGLNLSLEMAQYHNKKKLDTENKKIQKNNKITFKLNDIKYLFLKSQDETEPFLSRLRSKYSEEEIKEIKNKIQTIY